MNHPGLYGLDYLRSLDTPEKLEAWTRARLAPGPYQTAYSEKQMAIEIAGAAAWRDELMAIAEDAAKANH